MLGRIIKIGGRLSADYVREMAVHTQGNGRVSVIMGRGRVAVTVGMGRGRVTVGSGATGVSDGRGRVTVGNGAVGVRVGPPGVFVGVGVRSMGGSVGSEDVGGGVGVRVGPPGVFVGVGVRRMGGSVGSRRVVVGGGDANVDDTRVGVRPTLSVTETVGTDAGMIGVSITVGSCVAGGRLGETTGREGIKVGVLFPGGTSVGMTPPESPSRVGLVCSQALKTATVLAW